MNNALTAEYRSLSGIDVRLDAATVRNALTRGNGKVTDQEVMFFVRTCQAKKLDPLENGECYLIKYDDRTPAQMVVGYFAYIRRADRFPDYRGFKAGVCVAFKQGDRLLTDESGRPMIERREGAAVYRQLGEILVGGWCRVYRERRDGNTEENYMEVTLDEYSTGRSNWNTKPATMIRKCAVSQAFRAAYPNEYEGLYTEDELTASGAIPASYREVCEADEAQEEATKEQKQALFRFAKDTFGESANDVVKAVLGSLGFETTNGMKPSDVERATEAMRKIAEDSCATVPEEGSEPSE